DPYDDTDQTINRVARRLNEGQAITASNPASYFYAVARNLWRERPAGPFTETAVDGNLPPEAGADPTPPPLPERGGGGRTPERRLACLEKCLQRLSTKEHELIITYYQGEGRAKIEARRRLANHLAISAGTLRLKACRIRSKLENGVNRCLTAKWKKT